MMTGREKLEADRLGIPPDAEAVVIFGESSHWDPNWLLTSEEYYRLRIRRVLDAALRELEAEPGRVYGIECVFFLKMYWERNPEKREKVLRLMNEGRLRMTGCGMTTPDVILPDIEAIIRDYLLGQEWLRGVGIDQEPEIAYLPDDFGFPPTVPGLLSSLGIDRAAVTRIDGSYFRGTDYRPRGAYPLPGTSAELLQKELRSADFIWMGPDGSRVLCHWNPFTYFQGDDIALMGPGRWMGIDIGVPSRSPGRVADRIERYARQLLPLARTRYMFCPIGCDFSGPVRGLVGLLDAYNRSRYPETGIYVLNAGLDDYMNLLDSHRGSLPVLELDMTPYWAGFFSSRPEMKQRCRRLVRDLVRADALLAVAPEDRAAGIEEELSNAWEVAVVANHHDFITGTSPERVWKKEQLPWLVGAQERVERALEALGAGEREGGRGVPGAPAWELEDGLLRVETRHYAVTLSEAEGGCIVSWLLTDGSGELLAGPGDDVVSYSDSGGLWRMGNEYAGGVFYAKERSCRLSAAMSADERSGVLHVRVSSSLEGRRLVRELWFREDSPFVRMRLTGSAAKRRTVTVRFSTRLRPGEIVMDVPGGVVARPLVKSYDPTFWAAESFAHLVDRSSGIGLALVMGGPASVSAGHNGTLDAIALRNAPRERAFGLLPVLSHPAYGEDPAVHSYDYAVAFTSKGGWRENGLHEVSREILEPSWLGGPVAARFEGLPSVEGQDVRVIAFKRAHRGAGLIVRLQSFGASEAVVDVPDRTVTRAFLCDARERDLEELEPGRPGVTVPLQGAVTTVRLLP